MTTKQTTQEVIFGLIVEEIFPQPEQRSVPSPPLSNPEDFWKVYQQEPVRRTVPLTQLQVRVKVSDEMDSRAADVAAYVKQSMVRQLAEQLAELLIVDSTPDVNSCSMIYRAVIYVAPPKALAGRRSVDVIEMPPIKYT